MEVHLWDRSSRECMPELYDCSSRMLDENQESRLRSQNHMLAESRHCERPRNAATSPAIHATFSLTITMATMFLRPRGSTSR